MLPHKHTKEGVLNEKLALKKLLTYMKSVYKIPQKIKGLSDERKRKPIPLFNIVMPVLIFLMLQYESFHTIFSAPESMEKRPKTVSVEKSQKLMQSGIFFPGLIQKKSRKFTRRRLMF